MFFIVFGVFGAVQEARADFNDKKITYDVNIGSHQGFIHFPGSKIVDAQFPWVWYAPYNGGTPSRNDYYIFEKLAEAGIAVVAVDNGDSRGDKDGIAVFNRFYERLTDFDIGCDFFTYEIDSIKTGIADGFRYPALFKTKTGDYDVIQRKKGRIFRITEEADLFAGMVSAIGFPGGGAPIILNRKTCRIAKKALPKSQFGDRPKFLKKPCLLGGSRGGLMHYSWALKNADKVSCIAGVYPVLDPRLWPGTAEMAKIYHMTEQGYLDDYKKHSILSGLHLLAERRIPIFHMHGNLDKMVPYKSEREFVAKYLRLGGEISLVTSWGNDHDDSMDYFGSQEMVDFLIYQSTKNKLHEDEER